MGSYKNGQLSCFPGLAAAGKGNEEESGLCPSLPVKEVRWTHVVLHRVRQP